MRDTTALPVLTVTSRDCPKGHTHDPEEAGTPCLCWLPTTRRWRCRPVGGKAGLSMAMQIPWRRCRPLCACFCADAHLRRDVQADQLHGDGGSGAGHGLAQVIHERAGLAYRGPRTHNVSALERTSLSRHRREQP